MKHISFFLLCVLFSPFVFANDPSLTKSNEGSSNGRYHYSIIKNQNEYLGSFNKSISENNSKQESLARPNFPGNFMLDVGIIALQNYPGEMTQNHWRSKGVNLYYLWEVPLGASKFSLNPGIGLGLERLTFIRNYTLVSETITDGSEIGFVPAQDLYEGDVNIRRSRMTASYVDIPLELRWHSSSDFNRAFKVAIGGVFGLLIDSKTKIQYEEDGASRTTKQKESYNLNPIRYGAIARVGIGGFNVFGYYNISRLFRNNEGPLGTEDTNYFKMGLSLTLF